MTDTTKKTKKQYHFFSDKFGNDYGFDNYMGFAKFWFNIRYAVAKASFEPEVFRRLQYEAANSREARQPLKK